MTTAVTGAAPPADAELPCQERSAALARRLVTERLAFLGLTGLTEDAVLLVSELVGNSVRHGTGDPIRVAVRRRPGGTVRITVEDSGPGLPRLIAAADDDECHRGLALVDALAAAWGSAPTPYGKATWAELPG